MTTEAEQRAIDEAKAKRGGSRRSKGETTAKSVDNSAGVGNIQAQLDKARNDIRRSTKAYVLGGIADGLSDIASGDFGEAGDNIMTILEDFSSSLGDLESASQFQLPPSDESKKMLPSANVIDVA